LLVDHWFTQCVYSAEIVWRIPGCVRT